MGTATQNFDSLATIAREFPKWHEYFENSHLNQLDTVLTENEIALPSAKARAKAKTVLAGWYIHRCLDVIVAAEYVPSYSLQNTYETLALLVSSLLADFGAKLPGVPGISCH